MKVVLDTNLLISAFITPGGELAQVVKLLQSEGFHLLLSADVFTEIERVLRYPRLRTLYHYTDTQIDAFVDGIRRIAIWVEETESLVTVQTTGTENRFIALAVAGSARYIVTSDKRNLLTIRRYQSIEIVSPTEFLALIRAGHT